MENDTAVLIFPLFVSTDTVCDETVLSLNAANVLLLTRYGATEGRRNANTIYVYLWQKVSLNTFTRFALSIFPIYFFHLLNQVFTK